MTTDQTGAESDQETIRRLARASQELAAALSDATRTAGASETAPTAVTTTPEHTEPEVRVEGIRQSGVRRAARALAWPARRLLDSRFQGLVQQLDQKQIDLFDRLEALRQEQLLHHRAERAALTRILTLLEQFDSVRGDGTPGFGPEPSERPPKASVEAERSSYSIAVPSRTDAPITAELPVPPLEMRALVGEPDPSAFDNPDGVPVFPEIGSHQHHSVFDFGCGCGRIARKLLQQRKPPQRYVGIDLHRGMVDWCRSNLEPRNNAFKFFHHDVYNRSFNPDGVTPPRASFPITDEQFTLVNAHSVFTHILEEDAPFYLRECARILAPQGVFRSTWFLFDKSLFPMMQEFQNALYVNTIDPTNAVIVDRDWLQTTLRDAGLTLVGAIPPEIRGFQWTLLLRHAGLEVDEIDLPDDVAPVGLARPPIGPPDAFRVGL